MSNKNSDIELTEKAQRDRSEFYKMMFAICLSVIVTMTTGWVVFGKNAVTRDEVMNLMVVSSPYAQDKGKISEQLLSVNATLCEIKILLSKKTEEYDQRIRDLEIVGARIK